MLMRWLGRYRRVRHRARKNTEGLQLYYWSPGGDRENFGDALSPVIVQHVLMELGFPERIPTCNSTRGGGLHLLAIGSVIHHATPGDVIWGAGINGKVLARAVADRLDIRMVRGPLTRDYLLNRSVECPPVYGDPALLISRYYRPTKGGTEGGYILIPNLRELEFFRPDPALLDPTTPWTQAVDRIARSELVVSSSLHGIIVAESFGVPARPLLSLSEPLLKYEDYFLATGRAEVRYARSVKEALSLGGVEPPVFNPEDLISSFPIDLL